MIKGRVRNSSDFASRQSDLFYSLDPTTSSAVFLANCRKNAPSDLLAVITFHEAISDEIPLETPF